VNKRTKVFKKRLYIATRDINRIEAIRDDEIVAIAHRRSPGSLWNIILMSDESFAPHVKISRHLPEETQKQLVRTLLRCA
jgi:hypothetical protein